ncbi:MAG: lysoplasmalogenase family protein [Burkholderiaceae bacterium]
MMATTRGQYLWMATERGAMGRGRPRPFSICLRCMRLKDTPMLSAVVAIGTLVTVAGQVHGKPELVWIFTPLTSAVISWAAWRRGVLADRYAQGVFIGLLLCLFADLALIPRAGVAAGAVFVGASTLAFMFACGADAMSARGWPLALTALAVQGALIASVWPALSPPLLALAALVGMLGAVALAAFATRARRLRAGGLHGWKSAPLAVIGQALLVLATSLRMIDQATQVSWAPIWIQPMHWLALTLLALSIPWHAQRISENEGVAAVDDAGPRAGVR